MCGREFYKSSTLINKKIIRGKERNFVVETEDMEVKQLQRDDSVLKKDLLCFTVLFPFIPHCTLTLCPYYLFLYFVLV
jgi:hypothetical protein